MTTTGGIEGKRGAVDVAKRALNSTPEIVLYLGVSLLVVDEFARTTFGYSFLGAHDFRLSLAVGLTALFTFTFARKLDRLNRSVQKLRITLGEISVMPAHEHVDFRQLLQSSHEVRLLALSGTKTGLGDSEVLELLASPRRKCKVTILLANPRSPAILRRYSDDEPAGYEAGPDGIERRLLALQDACASLSGKARRLLDIRVYDGYPTISILQADELLYSTTYGFKLRGGDCPKVVSKTGSEYGTFLLKHFSCVYKAAVPLTEWIDKHRSVVSK
jgi:hypothetical protein